MNSATPMQTFQVPWFSRGRVLESAAVRPSQFLEYLTGDYYIQDAGSMLALALLDALPGEAICDLCAAPGGKASSILESLTEADPTRSAGGWLLANEPIKTRLPILEYALGRTGQFRFATSSEDPAQLAKKFSQVFDAVLVDAPCSGQALVANQKRDHNAYDARQIEHSAARQRRILLEAVRLLKPGGRLIYSTCTFAIEENEEQVQFLIDQFPNAWEPIQSKSLASWASPLGDGCYRVWPHRDPTAGAFAAGLKLTRRIDHEELDDIAPEKSPARDPKGSDYRDRSRSGSKKKAQNQKPHLTKSDLNLDWLQSFGNIEGLQTKLVGDRITVLSSDVQINEEIFGLRWAEVAVRTGNRWEPKLPLALSHGKSFRATREIELNDKHVKDYFVGQAIQKDSTIGPQLKTTGEAAWCVALCRGKPIGWLKDAGTRFNNLLPKIAYQQLVGD